MQRILPNRNLKLENNAKCRKKSGYRKWADYY